MAIEQRSTYESTDPIEQNDNKNNVIQEVDTKIVSLMDTNKGKTQKLTDEQWNDIQYYTTKDGSINVTTWQGRESPNTPYTYLRIDKTRDNNTGNTNYSVYKSKWDGIGAEDMVMHGSTNELLTINDQNAGMKTVEMKDIQDALNTVQQTLDTNQMIVDRKKAEKNNLATQQQRTDADKELEQALAKI